MAKGFSLNSERNKHLKLVFINITLRLCDKTLLKIYIFAVNTRGSQHSVICWDLVWSENKLKLKYYMCSFNVLVLNA